MLKRAESGFERLIFASRWLQAPFYAGLIIAQIAYTYKFGVELWDLLFDPKHSSGNAFLGGVLELIDFVMVANLMVVVVIGGYATFVSKLDIGSHADRPDWLEHIDPGTIKVKLAGSLVGISSIQLLQSFIHLGSVSIGDAPGHEAVTSEQFSFMQEQVKWQIILHLVFLVSAIVLAFTEMVMHRRQRSGERVEADAAPAMG
jgi:uncharacterized protein (TIGR00645 family)